MKIYLFSKTKNIEKSFAAPVKAGKYALQVSPPADMKKGLKDAPGGSVIYVDLSSFAKAELPQALKLLGKLEGSLYGIIDPKGTVDDVAGLFHDGAADYIGAAQMKKGLQKNRIERILKFKNYDLPDEKKKALKKNYILSGSDWKNVREGQEYTFCFLFIELDNKSGLKAAGPEQFTRLTTAFRQYVEEKVTPYMGRLWMWMDYGGLVIFPFDGGASGAVEAALRLMINRVLMSAELIHLDIALSYRVAMHIGNSEYKGKGETGTIIADSINSVFHLGQKFAEPGRFYVTDEMFLLMPSGMMNYFVPAGEYEGRNILRMKQFV
jgi:hypothetical protein